MSNVYEWRTFDVGDRVRIRLSGECTREVRPKTFWGTEIGEPTKHPLEADGMVGTVEEVLSHRDCADWHRFNVKMPYGTLLPVNGRRELITHMALAAIELEPLEAAP